MRAVVWTEYGPPDGLQLRDVVQPSPKPGEVLVRIRAAGVAAGDCELRALRFSLGLRILVRLLMGLTRPRNKILGQEFAGEVETVGAGVTRLHVGDAVFGTTGFGFGAYAEYVCVRERSRDGAVAVKPGNMSFEEAATIPTGGLEALHFLRAAGPLTGRSVLINGAGGGIGLLAVQLAKFWGADVTGVDGPRKLELMRAAGADRVMDYTQVDFSESSGRYDVILDVVGRRRLSNGLRALQTGGSYLLANPRLGDLIRGRWITATTHQRVVVRGPRPRPEELDFLRGLIEAGRVRSLIDRRYPLAQAAEAHRSMDEGRAVGRLVLTL